MNALVLAAGYATRLYPITKDFPKPLLEVGGMPIITHIIHKLAALRKIKKIFVVTNNKFFGRFGKWAKTVKLGGRLVLLNDLTSGLRDRLGAVGDMNFAIKNSAIRDDLLIIGGDNLFEGGLEGFLEFAEGKRPHPVIGAYDIKKRGAAKKYGVLKVNGKFRIVDFREKPRSPASSLVAMCLYYFPRQSLPLVKMYMADRRQKHDATGSYIDWLRKKTPVYCYVFKGQWYDIGDLNYYNQAKKKFA